MSTYEDGSDAIHGELPRFVELLRLSQGPIDDEFHHCGKRPAIDELEEFADAALMDDDRRMRAIFRCGVCGRFFWGWWD